jgi:hypothetical protein
MGAAVAVLAVLTGCSHPVPDLFPRTPANVALCRDVKANGPGKASSDWADGDQGKLRSTWRHTSKDLSNAALDAFQDPANPYGMITMVAIKGGMKELRSACWLVMRDRSNE